MTAALLTAEDVLAQVRKACDKSCNPALYPAIRDEFHATGVMPDRAMLILNLEQVPMWRKKGNL